MNKRHSAGRSAPCVMWATSEKVWSPCGQHAVQDNRMNNEQVCTYVCMYVCMYKDRFLPACFSMRYVQ